MSESKLDRYARMTPSRTHTGKSQQGERQCAVWINYPAAKKSDHPGDRLYNFITFEGKQVWLCRKCLVDMAEFGEFMNRKPANKPESAIARVSIADVEEKKSHDVILTIQRSSDLKETIRCEAYPAW